MLKHLRFQLQKSIKNENVFSHQIGRYLRINRKLADEIWRAENKIKAKTASFDIVCWDGGKETSFFTCYARSRFNHLLKNIGSWCRLEFLDTYHGNGPLSLCRIPWAGCDSWKLLVANLCICFQLNFASLLILVIWIMLQNVWLVSQILNLMLWNLHFKPVTCLLAQSKHTISTCDKCRRFTLIVQIPCRCVL